MERITLDDPHLLRCPCCNNKAEFLISLMDTLIIMCIGCGLQTDSVIYSYDKKEAKNSLAATWNSRKWAPSEGRT